ncbi:MAG: hypothetical protein ACYDD7_20600, partial [Acidimicrobiales bacterium]
MDRDDDFDLQLDWANGPAPARSVTPVAPSPAIGRAGLIGSTGSTGHDRMRLVLALGQSEVELRGAIDAIDARAVDWDAASGQVPGALEEVREYIAAAFDAVRELTGQLVVLTDRLELAPGRPEPEQMRELIEATSAEQAAPVDPGLAEELVTEFGDFTARLERVVERVEIQQRELRAEFVRLVDELASYRRRVQVHARPPVVTDEQLQTVISGIVEAMAQPQPRAGAADLVAAPETQPRVSRRE